MFIILNNATTVKLFVQSSLSNSPLEIEDTLDSHYY